MTGLPHLDDLVEQGLIPEPGERLGQGRIYLYRAHGRMLEVQERAVSEARFRDVGSYLLWGVEPQPYHGWSIYEDVELAHRIGLFLETGSLDDPEPEPDPAFAVSIEIEEFLLDEELLSLSRAVMLREAERRHASPGPAPGLRIIRGRVIDTGLNRALEIISGPPVEALTTLDSLVDHRRACLDRHSPASDDDPDWQVYQARLRAIAWLYYVDTALPDLARVSARVAASLQADDDTV